MPSEKGADFQPTPENSANNISNLKLLESFIQSQAELNDQKQLFSSIISVADIKELQHLEQILQHQVKVLDAIGDAITVTHRNGTIMFVNESMIKSSGFSKEALIGNNYLIFLVPAFGASSLNILRQVTNGGTWEGDISANHPVAGVRQGRLRISPLYDESGKVIGMVNVTVDTQDRSVEEQLQAQKEILETLGDALVTIDLNGTFIYVSDITLKVGDWQKEGVIGRNIKDFVIPEYHDKIPIMLKAIKEGKIWLGDLPARHGDGKVYHGLVHTSPLRNYRGEIIGAKGIVVDVRPREEPGIKPESIQLNKSDMTPEVAAPPNKISIDVSGQVKEIKGHLEVMRAQIDRIDKTLSLTGSPDFKPQDRTVLLPSELPVAEPSKPIFFTRKRLEVYCLGSLKVYSADRQVQHWPGKRARAVFEYLIARPKIPVARDVLEESIWPNQNPHSAAQNLRAAVHDLRQVLGRLFGDEAFPSVLFTQGSYLLNPEMELGIDATEFERHCDEARHLEKKGQEDAALQAYLQAEALYHGDYLEEELYEEWAISRREALKNEYLFVLSKLADYVMKRKDYEGCVSYCQKILTKDACREDVYRRLMCCYSRMGQRNRAIQWYRTCRQTIKAELHTSLDQKSIDLYQRLTSGQDI